MRSRTTRLFSLQIKLLISIGGLVMFPAVFFRSFSIFTNSLTSDFPSETICMTEHKHIAFTYFLTVFVIYAYCLLTLTVTR